MRANPERHVEEAIGRAERLCAAHGAAVTPLRRAILAILARAEGPLGAYAIIDELAHARERPVGPPTVYRTLELFVSLGCVVKLESRNAFLLCDAPGHAHHGMMLICKRCGKADEVENPRLEHLLQETVASTGFHPERHVVEVEGVCGRCWAGTG